MTAEELVAFAEALARIAAAGGGPKAFASHLANELGATVLVEDGDAKHLAAAGNGTPMPSSVSDFKANRHAGIALPISVGDALFGQIAVAGPGVSDNELAVRLVASAIGVELAREQGGHRGRKRTFWERLAGGGYQDAPAVRDEAAARGITLAASYVAVMLELEISDEARGVSERAELRRLAAEAFRSGDADVALLEGAALTFLVPAQREVDVANIRTAATLLPRTLVKKFPDARIAGGVGERATLLTIPRSVEQATHAMAIGRRVFGIGRVAAYEDLGIYPLLLEGADTSALRAFATRTLAPLRAYDDKHQTELERTLGVYFFAGENVKTAAAELNVHRHTVFYRLRQIAEICKYKLESPHDQLTLRLAIAIDALNKQ